MGRVISGTGMAPTPNIRFTREGVADVNGTWFLADKVGQKPISKTSIVFEFKLVDMSDKLAVTTGNKKTGYKDAEVGPGSIVSVFGTISPEGRPNQVADKLSQVAVGERVKMTFNGKVLNPANGHSYNDYTVEVI